MNTEKQKQVIQEILNSFNVGIETISATEGPTATLFDIRPKVGVRISRIKNLTEEIAVGLCSDKVRFTGAIPGAEKEECGNYQDHDLDGAKEIARKMKPVLADWTVQKLVYPE